ncbi:MAG: methyltransferase domain-containing protein [Elusimicrobiota bacterium]
MAEIIKPPEYNQLFLISLGLCLAIINKIRRTIIGYTSPRPFSIKEIERNVKYCLNAVHNWEEVLKIYTNSANPFTGKNVLELCPGQDIGTGIIILALGAKSYTAVDKNKLMYRTPSTFYNVLLNHLEKLPGYETAQKAAADFQKSEFNGSIRYIWDARFDLQQLSSEKFDILVSQAVLEHIVDIHAIFQILYFKLKPNAVMVHEVDLGTHTGFIRDLDPLNLLRYSDTVWNLVKFDGSPNRLRMTDYQNIFTELGFVKVETKQKMVLDSEYVKKVKPWLSAEFRKYPEYDIETKSFYLLAQKEMGTENE